MNSFTIKDLESLSGVKAHTIRIWEQRYSFLKPQRTDTNIRSYTNEELIKLLNIALLNKYGYKISHIDKMRKEDIEQKLVSLSSAEAHAELAVNNLIELAITMEVHSFEKQLDVHIAAKGIDKTIIQMIFPFLEKIGILWVTSHINPAQEHLVSNVIRQKIIIGIENIQPLTVSDRSIVLFLPETEHHELAILYLHFLLKSKGYKVYYLGANVPLKDLAFICKHKKPDALYAHITAPVKSFNLEKYLISFQNNIDSELIIGGPHTIGYRRTIPDKVKVADSSDKIMGLLQSVLFK
jgi:DNA-binding transcriptional MerR regulator